MWVPRSEQDIEQAIDAGTLRETQTFDAKAQLPATGKNKDLARDICAMTVDGGVLLYGLGGGDPTRPDDPKPFELAGASERIDQVAQTAISEPPTIEIHDIPAASGDGTGYLAVVIPPSPRAPHMVTLEGENRFYGRGATGNRILTEGEVARLYARRERWEVDRRSMLEGAIEGMPFKFERPLHEIGPMVVVARPVASREDLLDRARGDLDLRTFLQRELTQEARRRDPYPNQGTSGVGQALEVERRGAGVWILQRQRDPTMEYQSRLEITASCGVTYWHSPTINYMGDHRPSDTRLLLMEQSVTRALFQPLAVVAWLYEHAGYAGAVDVGVAVLDIERATGASLLRSFDGGTPYGAKDFRADARVPIVKLRQDLEGVTGTLLSGLFDVISLRDYDPFADAR